MKFVINRCYGGFGLSKEALSILGVENEWDIKGGRSNPALVSVVETLGEKANGDYSNLCIVEVPEEATDYTIDDYDGSETVICVVNGKLRFL